jgi:hypothetical protein
VMAWPRLGRLADPVARSSEVVFELEDRGDLVAEDSGVVVSRRCFDATGPPFLGGSGNRIDRCGRIVWSYRVRESFSETGGEVNKATPSRVGGTLLDCGYEPFCQ